MEEIKDQLVSLNGKRVVIIRPFFGTQSDSWSAQFTVHTTRNDIKFQFTTESRATIFGIDDVLKVELDSKIPTITLYGPNDY